MALSVVACCVPALLEETQTTSPNLRHCFLALLRHERVDLEVSLLDLAALDDVPTSFALPLLHLRHRKWMGAKRK